MRARASTIVAPGPYPVYPAVNFVTVHCLPQSTASTSSPIDVFTWRALVPEETDSAYRLQKLPAQHLPKRFVAELQSENSKGRAAQERGDWNTAMAKFETCRTMISEDLKKLVPLHVEEQDFYLLLAWADLPLAEVYQSLGGSDSSMLKKAMDMREEMLYCVTWILGSSFWPRGDNPLPTNNGIASLPGGLLVQVCVTYYYTARYEWGHEVNDKPARIDAVQKFAKFMGCSDDEAESQLCLLLSVDYLYLGRFEVGLGWIQEADRHWPQASPGVEEYRRILHLSKAELLMKVERFEEAIKTLDELQDSEHGKHLQSACYSQMSKRAKCNGNFEQANDYERQAKDYEEESKLEGSDLNSLQLIIQGQIPLSHPMLKATPCPLGSSLGLVREGYGPLRNELRKLPVMQFVVMQGGLLRGERSEEDRDWKVATYWYERLRELLKLATKVVEKQTYDWLLSWFGFTLAHFYHYHTSEAQYHRKRRFEKVRTIWVDLLSSASHQMGSAHEFLLHGYRFNLAAVLFEGFGEVLDQPYHVLDGNKARGTDSNTKKRHSCFWLYFGHHRAWNYETALHWLRESKRLKEEHIRLGSNFDCPEMTCSDDDYFCCDYDYLRCEADLLMRLQKFGKAIPVLEELLRTRHVQRGSRLLARQAREWLHRCRYPKVDDERGNATAEKLSSTFGCIQVDNDDFTEIMLIQSQAGLVHHLHQLPVSLHMAFRWHGNRGSSFLKQCKWEAAIFEFEWCREILKIIRVQSSEVEQVKACDWLMVWASVPLADTYEFRKKQIKKALDLRVEIATIIATVYFQLAAPCEDVKVVCVAMSLLFVGSYHYSVSEYPHFKDEVVRAFGGWLRLDDDWASEDRLLRFLYNSHMTCGNDEAALRFIRQAKEVFYQRFSGQELDHMDKLFRHVLEEARCLSHLHRHDDAAKVLSKYSDEISDKAGEAKNIPEKVLNAQTWAKVHAQFSKLENDKHRPISPTEMLDIIQNLDNEILFGGSVNTLSMLTQLRLKSMEFSKNGKLQEAVDCYENSCVELIDKNRNEGLEGALDDELLAPDYVLLSQWRTALIFQTIGSCSYEQIKAYRQDVNLLRTVHYYEKVIELSSNSWNSSNSSAVVHGSITALYFQIDEYYVDHLLKRYDKSVDLSQMLFFFIMHHMGDGMHRMKDDLHDFWRRSYRDIHSGDPRFLQDAIKEIKFFLDLDNQVDKYGEEAVTQFTNLLYSMDMNAYTENWWVEILEDHSILYTVLQNHHYRRVRCFAFLTGPGDDFQKQIETGKWNAFRFAEAERAQVMLYQQLVASNKFNSSQQWGHDARNVCAVEGIRKLCATVLKGPSVYVQYSSCDRSHECFYIYVIDQDGKLSIIRSGDHEGGTRSAADKKTLRLEKSLKNLYRFFEKGNFGNYNGDSMKKDLMFLHELLIKPIAHILVKMKPDDNLILCPSELITKVPFAALRDPENSQKYLIELHTISLIPSLRVLQSCSKRLEELQSSHSYTGCAGSIIALGDPNYKCLTCEKKFKRLKGTRAEVKHIAKLFGKQAVKKLLGPHATKEQLQFWAAKASDGSSCFRQAIVHIGAHGTVDEKHDRKIVSLHLACDGPASSANTGALSLSDDTSSSDEESTSEPPGKRHKVESNDNSDEDGTNSDDEESDLQVNTPTSKPFMNMQSMFKYTSLQATSQGASSSRSRANIGRNAGTTQQSVASHALRVEDLNNSEWRAELVVLSTCRSARGRTTTEGEMSIARAFMAAGVPCVVASQWNVVDGTTPELMKEFYEQLHQGKNVASALRSSMLAYMSEHRDAVGHWAPFNVWGVPSLCLPENLLNPPKSREHPMSVRHLQAGGEGNDAQFPSTNGGEELSSSTKDSIGGATSSCPVPPPQSNEVCDGCRCALKARQWHCNECPNSFNLCKGCHTHMVVNQREYPPHSRDHPMILEYSEYIFQRIVERLHI